MREAAEIRLGEIRTSMNLAAWSWPGFTFVSSSPVNLKGSPMNLKGLETSTTVSIYKI
jgi:hypothetical protein